MVKNRLAELQRLCDIDPSSHANHLTLTLERRPIDDEIAGVLRVVTAVSLSCGR